MARRGSLTRALLPGAKRSTKQSNPLPADWRDEAIHRRIPAVEGAFFFVVQGRRRPATRKSGLPESQDVAEELDVPGAAPILSRRSGPGFARTGGLMTSEVAKTRITERPRTGGRWACVGPVRGCVRPFPCRACGGVDRTRPEYSHGFLMVPVAIWLVKERWGTSWDRQTENSWRGGASCCWCRGIALLISSGR